MATETADVLMAMENITEKNTKSRYPTTSSLRRPANPASNSSPNWNSPARRQKAPRRRLGALKCESVNSLPGRPSTGFISTSATPTSGSCSRRRKTSPPSEAIPDNFQFPRWCLDMSVLRAYDSHGKPASRQRTAHTAGGPETREPVFVSGHPGATDCLLTVAELEELRDEPCRKAAAASELRGRYIQYGKTGPEATA